MRYRTVVLGSISLLIVFGAPSGRVATGQDLKTGQKEVAATGASQPGVMLKPLKKGTAPPSDYPKELVDRGRLLVMSGSCNDCHTPWTFDSKLGAMAPDWSRMLSGHPADGPDPQGELAPGDIAIIGPTLTSFKLPFGITYALNLTPDIDTGTGSWTEKMFIDIFRKGRHLGGNGRAVYPPMPWHYLRFLPDEDLRAIFAYLRSVPPLTNLPPTEKIPPPVAEFIIGLNDKIIALQTDPHAVLQPAVGAPEPPPVNLKPVMAGKGPNHVYPPELVKKGELMVMAGLCNDCHTPWIYNKALGVQAPDMSRMLSGHPEGAPDPQGTLGKDDLWIIGPTFTSHHFNWGTVYSRNLTPDTETGIGGWTEDQFVSVFRKGHRPDGRPLCPPMPWSMIAHHSDTELKAIYAYLQSLPPIHNSVPDPKVTPAKLAEVGKTNKMLAAEQR